MSEEGSGSLANRLMSRNGGPGLQRVSMPDGGEAYSGPLAQRALNTLGARAFTVDRSVILSRNFDRDNPEDMGLYAHEAFHQRMAAHRSADAEGGASHDGRDAEEIAARKMERMVVHQAKQGADFGSTMGKVHSGEMDDAAKGGSRGPDASKGDGAGESGAPAAEGGAGKPDAMKGYWALRKKGHSHERIVDDLKRHVMAEMERQQEEQAFRRGLR